MSKFIGYELTPATETNDEVLAHDDETSSKAVGHAPVHCDVTRGIR